MLRRLTSSQPPGTPAPWWAAGLLLLCTACSESNLEISTGPGAEEKSPSLVEIYTPNSGDIVPAHTPFTLEFAVVRGSGGEYVEVQVDKQKPVKVAHTRGHHLLPGLEPGPHTLSVKEFDRKGKPTGGRTAVTIVAQ